MARPKNPKPGLQISLYLTPKRVAAVQRAIRLLRGKKRTPQQAVCYLIDCFADRVIPRYQRYAPDSTSDEAD